MRAGRVERLRGLSAFFDLEEVGEAGDFEHSPNAFTRVAQDETLTLGFDALFRLYEQAEPGRVDEVERFDVDHKRVATLLREIDQRGAQRGSRAEFEVTRDSHDCTPVVVLDRERDRRLSRSVVGSHESRD